MKSKRAYRGAAYWQRIEVEAARLVGGKFRNAGECNGWLIHAGGHRTPSTRSEWIGWLAREITLRNWRT